MSTTEKPFETEAAAAAAGFATHHGEHDGGAGAGLIKPSYDERLTNEDLAPLKEQTWSCLLYTSPSPRDS